MNKYLLIILFAANLFSQSNQRGEILSETPLYPLPENMTFEEYQDMNRRLSIGVGLAFIPMPGIIHRYAGEKELAKRLSYVSIGGFISLVGSLSGSEEKEEWGDSDYEILIMNQGLEDETRFEKIPIEIIGDDSIKYKLNQVYKKVTHSGGSPFLGAIGIMAIIGSYYYDVFYGLKRIHDKREAVRFKYGKQLKFSLRPSYDYYASEAKINFDLSF